MHAPKWHMRSKCHTKYNTISMPTDIKQQEENKRHVECDGAKKPTKPTDIAFPFHVRLASKVVAWSISTRIISLRVHFFQFLFSCLFLLCRFLWCVRKRKKRTSFTFLVVHSLCACFAYHSYSLWPGNAY